MKGFITIATGEERYFKLATNLLKSYRLTTNAPKPFCIITDRENEYTKEFDDVVVINNTANSFLDKFLLIPNTPYDETIFIDADCLAYHDLNLLFDVFKNSSDFSCFGEILPIESKEGWFTNERLGKYEKYIDYIIGMHGGIYFMRKSETANRVLKVALDIAENYNEYSFQGFNKAADEPIYAMAMSVCNCRTEESLCEYFAWLQRVSISHVDFFGRRLAYKKMDKWGGYTNSGWLIHFGNNYTEMPLYKIESSKVNYEYLYHRVWEVYERIIYTIKGYLQGWYGFCRNGLKRIKRKINNHVFLAFRN